MNKERLKEIGKETLEISNKGFYKIASQKTVSIEKETKHSVDNTILYKTEDLNELLNQIQPSEGNKTQIEVTNETTLDASKRLIDKGFNKVLALNFASAKHPGGGFLTGAVAQEESLARASSLYQSLVSKNKFYEHNKGLLKNGLYSDYMIYSPDVPVFRNEKNTLLDDFYTLSFITSPAVNAGIARERKVSEDTIHKTMKERIEKILSVALHHQHDVLVLGAFGCGVFKNHPKDVVGYFNEILNSQKFKNQFKKIIFAVYDSSPAKLNFYAFKNGIKLNH